jgi:hypothetical protein
MSSLCPNEMLEQVNVSHRVRFWEIGRSQLWIPARMTLGLYRNCSAEMVPPNDIHVCST